MVAELLQRASVVLRADPDTAWWPEAHALAHELKQTLGADDFGKIESAVTFHLQTDADFLPLLLARTKSATSGENGPLCRQIAVSVLTNLSYVPEVCNVVVDGSSPLLPTPLGARGRRPA